MLLQGKAPEGLSARMDALAKAIYQVGDASLGVQQVYCSCAQLMVDGVNGRTGLPVSVDTTLTREALLSAIGRINGMD